MLGEITTPPFSSSARIQAGYLLRQVQKGIPLSLPHSRPMPSIGTYLSANGIKMDKRKKEYLEGKGYKIGSANEFLGLSVEESEYIKLKLALSEALAKQRKNRKLTQAQLAKMLKSSQSRIAKMERGDPTVSVDLLVKSLLAMGADNKSIAKAISGPMVEPSKEF
jgi:predicted XRE-type DNA-binding protein